MLKTQQCLPNKAQSDGETIYVVTAGSEMTWQTSRRHHLIPEQPPVIPARAASKASYIQCMHVGEFMNETQSGSAVRKTPAHCRTLGITMCPGGMVHDRTDEMPRHDQQQRKVFTSVRELFFIAELLRQVLQQPVENLQKVTDGILISSDNVLTYEERQELDQWR